MSQNMYWFLFCKENPRLAVNSNRRILEEIGKQKGVLLPDDVDFYQSCLDHADPEQLATISEVAPNVVAEVKITESKKEQ